MQVVSLTLVISVVGMAQPELGQAKDLDFGSYFRSGIGMNALGGREDCVTNQGSLGNEFRLGNECSMYAELYLNANLLKRETPDSPFFKTTVTIAINGAPQNTQYESSSVGNPTSSYLAPIEGYAQGGNFDGVHMSYWAGKRFYRDVNSNMNDFFYFANMSGTGGGVGDINVGVGKLRVAVLQETPLLDTASGSGLVTGAPVTTADGQIAKQALDIRLDTVNLGADDNLHFWEAVAREGGGSALGTGTGTYVASAGFATGVRYRHTIDQESFNDVSFVFGEGVMQTLDMTAPLITNGSIANGSAWRFRAIDNGAIRLSDRWGSEFTTTFESRRSATALNSHSNWFNIGARPTYFMTDHFHLTGQAGFSLVKDEADQQADGTPLGARTLFRATISPEVNLEKSVFGRPVIRFFVTWSHWNLNNQNFMAASGPEYTSQVSGLFYGFQTEYWF